MVVCSYQLFRKAESVNVSWNAIEPFEIALSVIDLRGRFYCYWNYRSDLFEEEMIRSLGERYNELLESVCQCELAENPS